LAKSRRTKLLRGLIAGCLLLGAIALIWTFTPANELLKPERVVRQLEAIDQHRGAPFIFIAVYLIGGLVMFPVTVLGAAAAIVFPPYKAVMVSFSGIMLSAALHHFLGARLIKGRAQKALGATMKKLDSVLSDRGVVTIAAMRMIPIAPFTLVNLAAGGMGVRFRDFMLGTALGLAPSITMICIFGRQVRAFWKHPSGTGVALVVAVCLAWLAMAVGLQMWIARWKGKSQGSRKAQGQPVKRDSQRRTKRSEA
jgi:phospholipase D1/2